MGEGPTKKFTSSIIVLLYLFASVQASLEQNQTVSGFVTNVQTGEPIKSANVFIANTTMGDATDDEGRYLIRNIPPGSYEIVVSAIGYEIDKRGLVVTQDSQGIIFNLVPKVIQMPEVVVTAADKKRREKDLKKFLKFFLSTTRNASQTKIINPQVLEFSRTTRSTLIVVAQEPLLIENMALGYKITYILKRFVATSDYVKYSGIPRFEDLEPSSPEQLEEWERNRRIAYAGSFRHFLKTITQQYDQSSGTQKLRRYRVIANFNSKGRKRTYTQGGLLDDEGFSVLWIDDPWLMVIDPLKPKILVEAEVVNTNHFLGPGIHATDRTLKFPNYLEVTYLNEFEDSRYLRFIGKNRAVDAQTSWIKLESDSVFIDFEGRYFDQFKINMFGYWSWERLADMVPYEYVLD